MTEVWKKIANFDNYYVSNLGNLKNIKDRRLKKSGLDYILLNQNNNNNGYLQIRISKDGKDYCFSAHRIIAETFIDNPDNLPQVNHIDKNKSNNNILNLEWYSAIYNNQSINKNRNIGSVYKGKGTFVAEIVNFGNTYRFSDVHEVICKEWLDRRREEIINKKELTEIDIRKRAKNGEGTIYLTKAGTFKSLICIDKINYSKTFKTKQEAKDFILECNNNYQKI